MFSEPDEDGNRRQVGIYYFLLEQYRPALGPPSVQGEDWTISRTNYGAWSAKTKLSGVST